MMIPESVYRRVEGKLFNAGKVRDAALRALDEARARAMLPTAPAPDGGIRSGGNRNRQEIKNLAVVQASIDAERAEKWELVLKRTQEMYPPDTAVGQAARLYYRERQTQAAVAAKLHIDRQTVRRRLDTYVINCALLAADEGLLDLTEKEG